MSTGVADIVNAYDSGYTNYAIFRKACAITLSVGVWFDSSMWPGNPSSNFYIGTPLTAFALSRTVHGGIEHGAAVSPAAKYLHKVDMFTIGASSCPLQYFFLDYLLAYPFIDQSVLTTQTMVNSATVPRYTTGAGVQIMPIIQEPNLGGSSFFVTYTNQDGVSGRTTPTFGTLNTAGITSQILSSPNGVNSTQTGPFLTLQAGDTGVRSIDSVTFTATDTGFILFLLVKPIISGNVLEVGAPSEIDFLIDRNILPVIKDDAYLNMIVNSSILSTAATYLGEITTFWSFT